MGHISLWSLLHDVYLPTENIKIITKTQIFQVLIRNFGVGVNAEKTKRNISSVTRLKEKVTV
jgi:hypothetical protein